MKRVLHVDIVAQVATSKCKFLKGEFTQVACIHYISLFFVCGSTYHEKEEFHAKKYKLYYRIFLGNFAFNVRQLVPL